MAFNMKNRIYKIITSAAFLIATFVSSITVAYAVPVSVPSAAGLGQMLVSLSTGNWQATTTDPAHFGSIFATSTATSTFKGPINATCFSVSGGACLAAGASSTLFADTNIWTGGNTFARSTTTNATATSIFATLASTTNFFGAGLPGAGCNGASNAVTWANGSFGCNSITAAASSTLLGDNNTWSGTNQYAKLTWTNATGTNATTSSLAVTNVTSALHLANATGGVIPYAGTSCTNQFPRSLSAVGAATCASVANTDLTNSSITINSVSVALGGTIVVASTTLLSDLNTWSNGNTFTRSTTTNATNTAVYVSAGLTQGNNNGFISATTTKSFNIASTTIDAMGKQFSIGTSTFLLMNDPRPFTLIGFYCTASTTGTAFVEFMHDNGNKTEMSTCTSGGFTRTLTNNTFTANENFNVNASSTAGTVKRVTVTASIYYTSN